MRRLVNAARFDFTGARVLVTGGSNGIGLAVARQLVEAHSGEIVAQNREEGGSRFSIRLPIGEPMQLPNEATA